MEATSTGSAGPGKSLHDRAVRRDDHARLPGSPATSSVRIGYRPGRSNFRRSSTLSTTSVGTSTVRVDDAVVGDHDRRAGVDQLHAVDGVAELGPNGVAVDVAADDVVDSRTSGGEWRVVRDLDGEGDHRDRRDRRGRVVVVVSPLVGRGRLGSPVLRGRPGATSGARPGGRRDRGGRQRWWPESWSPGPWWAASARTRRGRR